MEWSNTATPKKGQTLEARRLAAPNEPPSQPAPDRPASPRHSPEARRLALRLDTTPRPHGAQNAACLSLFDSFLVCGGVAAWRDALARPGPARMSRAPLTHRAVYQAQFWKVDTMVVLRSVM